MSAEYEHCCNPDLELVSSHRLPPSAVLHPPPALELEPLVPSLEPAELPRTVAGQIRL